MISGSYEDPRFQLYEGSDCDKNWERESDKLNVTDVSIHYSISYCASLCAANDLCSAFRYKHPGKKPGETCEHLRAACHVENLENAESASLTFTSYYVKKSKCNASVYH